MKIIGISGTNGSGKDTLGEILAKDYGWLFVSISDLLRHEAVRRGLAVERHNLRAISAEWRKQFGPGVLMDRAVEEYKNQTQHFNGLVISNLRNIGEANRVHELGVKIVWIDAEPQIRFQRTTSRGRSAEDAKTFQQFLQEEQDEMRDSGDENSLHMAGVKDKADIFLMNNSDDLDKFKTVIQNSLKL